MRQVARMAEGEPLSIHFMESPDELQLYGGEGSLAVWYERMGWQCDFLHYGSPAQRLAGSLGREQRIILVHNCCVREQDIELINSHFTHPVAWVVCPQSNAFISSLRPAEALLQRDDVMICVGTDSLASNTNLSIIEELKLRDFGTEEELRAKVAEDEANYKYLYEKYGKSTNREEYYLWQNANLKLLGSEDQLGYIIMRNKGTKIELLEDEGPAEALAYRLGGCCVIGIPGEAFVEFGLYLKAMAGFGTVIVNELTGGVLPGYMYTPESLVTGGYETDTSMLDEEFGINLMNAALAAARSLR